MTFRFAIFSVIFLLTFDNSNCNVNIDNREIKMKLNEISPFNLRVSNLIEVTELNFCVQHPDMITLLFNETLYVRPTNNSYSITLKVLATRLGKSEISITSPNNDINLADTFVRIEIFYSDLIETISEIVGWIYFAAWSISFYPQIYINYKRKSVVGLNFDYISFNVLGYIMYSIFNIGLYYIPELKREYSIRYPRGINPVQLNDIFFAVHGCLGTILTILQCFRYEKQSQKVSTMAKSILGFLITLTSIAAILSLCDLINWLDFIYWCSYVKLLITLTKYVPQAYMNYKRQSTVGWSIENVFLDFTGGILSLLQMFLIAYNYNDWISILGDPTKFGLGLFTIFFDLFFIVQHYILYANVTEHKSRSYVRGTRNGTNSNMWSLEQEKP